jgi:large subunit ribosomal protein L3
MVRKGILGTKLGMTQVFTDDGQVVPVTVLRAGPCPVVQVRTVERDGYRALQLGYGQAKRANKPLSGHFAAAGVEPTRNLTEVHGFAGLGGSHGVHKVHRAPGAIGACATPSRVFPGTRMAGRAGAQRVTIQRLEIVSVDTERGLLLIKGATPGANGSVVLVRSSVKAPVASGGDA